MRGSGSTPASPGAERPSGVSLRLNVSSLPPVQYARSSRPPISRAEQIQGGLLGLLVGDALGVPYEFRAPDELPPLERIDMEPPAGFRRAHGVAPGTWSDDGAQALCLVASLLDRGQFDLEDFVKRLVGWVSEGQMAVEGRVFDVCGQTLAALRAIRDGADMFEASLRTSNMNGAGALSRALPLALLHVGSETALVANAHLQSRVTHPHPRSLVSAALFCLWAYYELQGREDAFAGAGRRLQQLYQHGAAYRRHPEFARELAAAYGSERSVQVRGSTNVVDCLYSVVDASRERTYERVVRRAVSFGRAAGTIACLAGGIAGIRFGKAGIPERWLRALRGRDMLDPLLTRVSGMTRSRDDDV
ncbi:MAG: ADP-ribosylglycohydrolase family protein [Polyangiaceae bacterium]|nr:ADP-ribosylglycohydrolase family protein [Polyangiaceae bacterium]